MNKILHLKLAVLLLAGGLSLISFKANAQSRQQYTSSNIILIGLEGANGLMEFRSDHLRVRYDKVNQRVECRLPVNSLYALNDSIPSEMAYEVLFGSKYPELVIYIDAPDEVLNAPRLTSEPQSRRATIELQATPNEKRIPVTYASDKGVITLSTNFDLRMGHFRATLPAQYASVLNGRILVTIRNARWLNNRQE